MRERKVTADKEIIDTFGDYLKGGSPAEEWFDDEGKNNATWAELQTAFTTRFPTITKVKKSQAELEHELQALLLPIDALGKTEMYGGEDVYTHVIFAEKALDLAKRAKIASSPHLIWQVRDQLPDIIKDRIDEDYANWKDFHKAITSIQLGHIRDGIKKHERNKAEKDEIVRRLAIVENTQLAAPNSPTKMIRQQMEHTAITGTPQTTGPEYSAFNRNVFNSQAGGRGSLNFQTNTRPRTIVTEESKARVLARINEYPMQPATEDGRTKYRKQCEDWANKYGTQQRVTEHTGCPVTPGTVSPGSGECYSCARTGHEARDCRAPKHERVPEKERTWRAICGTVIGRRTQQATQVNAVTMDGTDDLTWMNTHGEDILGRQGNGGGPTM